MKSVEEERRRTIPRTMLDQAERFGGRPYIVFTHEPEAPFTYEEMATVGSAVGSRLSGDHGIELGTVGAILLPNGRDFIAAWCGYHFAGIVDIPISYEFKKATLLNALNTVGAKLIVTDADGFDRLMDGEVSPYLDRLELIVIAGPFDEQAVKGRLRSIGCDVRVVALPELSEPGPAARAWERVDAMSLSSIRFTSGTTGFAKGIMFCHLHLLARSMASNRAMTYEGGDILYSPLPLYHGLAGIMGAIGTMQIGATMVSAPRFSASRYWSDARDHKATLGHILYSLVPMLMKQPESSSDRDHSVRYLNSAWPHRKFEERFGTTLLQIYAQGEVGVITYRRGGAEEGSRNVGRPLPEIELNIVDALDRPLPAGEAGEIVVRPRAPQNIMLGYYNNLPATTRAFRNLWHHTGDRGFLTPEGDLHFLGRIGDTIRRRGVNISSEQIDEEIARHPDVLECGTIGVPSALGEEDIHTCIVWREQPEDVDAAMQELMRFLMDRLPRQHVPRYIEPVDALPRTGNGKVRKIELSERAVYGRRFDREAGVWLDPGKVLEEKTR